MTPLQLNTYQNQLSKFLVSLVMLAFPLTSFGQNLTPPVQSSARTMAGDNNLLTADYYLGQDLLADGKTLEAFQSFEKAYLGARASGSARGIDSVPPLVMMGECLYQLGDSGSAMQHFDAALNLSIASRNWLALLKSPTNRERPDSRPPNNNLWAPPTSKAIPYWLSTRQWPIALIPSVSGPNATAPAVAPPRNVSELPELLPIAPNNNARLPPIHQLPKIDALEVLRSQALALRRRFKLLGPLVELNPLTAQLSPAFASDLIKSAPEDIQLGARICFLLTMLGQAPSQQIAKDLTNSFLTSTGHEHPLTSEARLAFAELIVQSGAASLPDNVAFEATLTAARAGQWSALDEAVELWSQCVIHSKVDAKAVTKVLSDIQNFAQTRSRGVFLRCQLEQLRQASLRGNFEFVRKQTPLITGLLQPAGVELPRLEALLLYASSRGAFLEGNNEEGIQKLDEALAILRGTTPLSTASPPLYQLNLALRLVSTEAIPKEKGISILLQLLDGDRSGTWETAVLEELVFLTQDKLEARRAMALLALETDDKLTQLRTLEGWKAARILHTSLLQGRLTEFRRALSATTAAPAVQGTYRPAAINGKIHRTLPELQKQIHQAQAATLAFTRAPKWDIKKWPDDDRKKWTNAVRANILQESTLWNAATYPVSASNNSLPPFQPNAIFENLSESDSVLAFYSIDGEIHGFLVSPAEIQGWRVEDSATLEMEIRNALQSSITLQPSSEIGLAPLTADGRINNLGSDSGTGPSPVNPRSRLAELRKDLIPDHVWKQLALSERWILSPDGFLWDFPMELLPLEKQPYPEASSAASNTAAVSPNATTRLTDDMIAHFDPVLQDHRICYTPTLVQIPQLFPKLVTAHSPRVISSSPAFWSDSIAAQKLISSQLSGLKRDNDAIDSTDGQELPPPIFTKLACNHFISLREQHWSDPNKFVLLMHGKTPSTIADWNPLPFGAPKRIWLLGHMRDRLPSENIIEPGDEWLRWTSALIAQGTSNIIVSRWPVGGESTYNLVNNALDYSESTSLSEAWQRAAAINWSEEFVVANEPFITKTWQSATVSSGTVNSGNVSSGTASNRNASSGNASSNKAVAPATGMVSGSHPGLWSSYLILGDIPAPPMQ